MSTPPSLELDSVTLAEQYDRLGTRQFHHGLELLDVLAVRRGGESARRRLRHRPPDRKPLRSEPARKAKCLASIRLRCASNLRKNAHRDASMHWSAGLKLDDVPDAHYGRRLLQQRHSLGTRSAGRTSARVSRPEARWSRGFPRTMSQEAPHDLHLVLRALLAREPRWQAARVGAPASADAGTRCVAAGRGWPLT